MTYFLNGRCMLLVILLLCVSGRPVVAETPQNAEPVSFAGWLQDLRVQALAMGISEQILDQAFKDLEPDPRVLGFDRNQPEFTQTFDQYLSARVSEDRVRQGRQLYNDNRELLRQVGDRYGVDPHYLVAFWGLESSFGRHQGTYSVIRSLATLAYDPRRSAFFRNELLSALMILQEGHVSAEHLVGGWAGAMGQNQFIPSSFLRYAQDFDGDGRKDIWSNNADVWASIAYYLTRNGWTQNQGWGLKVLMPDGFSEQLQTLKPEEVSTSCRALKYHTRKMALDEWRKLGVTLEDGSPLPELPVVAALIIPEQLTETDSRETYLVFPNFRSILSYNCANKYAVSVGLMADRLAAPE